MEKIFLYQVTHRIRQNSSKNVLDIIPGTLPQGVKANGEFILQL